MVVTSHVYVGVGYCTVLNIEFQHFTGHVPAREKYVNVEIRYDPGKKLFSVSKCPNSWADAGRFSRSNTTSRAEECRYIETDTYIDIHSVTIHSLLLLSKMYL